MGFSHSVLFFFFFNQAHTNIFHSLRIDIFICQHLQINLIAAVHAPLSTQWAFYSQHNSSLSLNKWTLIHLNGVEITTPCCPRATSDRDSSWFSWSRGTSGVSHDVLFIGPLAPSPFLTWFAVFHTLYLKRNAVTVVYPKERLALQLSKHSWFSHTGQKSRHNCIVSFALK